MEERAEEFADLESQDTGKPRASLVADEIVQSVDQLRFFAGAARNLEGRSAGEYLAGHTSFVRREPIGVIGQVTPWNYPLNMAVWKIAPAIAAGNTVVLKPADTTPLSTLLLAEIVAEHSPAGMLNVVLGDRDTGASLWCEHPTPQMVAITGSVRAGMEVARSAANDLKRVHLELGGKAPAIVFADADPRGGRRGHRHPPRSSTPGRTAPQRRECSCTRRCTTSSSRRSSSAAGMPAPAPRTRRACSTAPSAAPPSSPRCRASSTGCPRTPRSRPAVAARANAATSSRRRSSRVCIRTTRPCRARSSARC